MPAKLKKTSGHRTGKGQFSFQSQKKAMPKNAQITTQLHSSHMLAASLVAQMVKNPTAMHKTDTGLIPGSGRSPVGE